MRRRIVKIVTALVASVTLAIGALGAAWLHGDRIPFASGSTILKITKLNVADNAGAPNGVFFMLLVGSDLRPGVGGARGDALHLVGVNPARNQATILDIPRDTCWNGDKINAANVGPVGNPRGQANAITSLTGIPINYVLEVDFDGFTSLIDGVGGINVDVQTQMHDTYSGAYFSPGAQHMNGSQALSYARDRHDFPSSDLVRTVNQGHLLLNALGSIQQSTNNAEGEFHILALLARHAQLDGIGIKDLYRLGRIAHHLDPATVKNVEEPTGGGNCLSLGGGAASLNADMRDDGILESH